MDENLPDSDLEIEVTTDQTLSVSGVSKLLNVHPNTVRLWADKGLIPFHREGSRGDRKFLREDLDAYLRSVQTQNSSTPEQHYESN